jgi:potassium efflux system protein
VEARLKSLTRCFLISGAIAAWLLSATAIGQPAAGAIPAATVTAPPATPTPEPLEAISLARETEDAAENARREIARLTDVEPFLEAIATARDRDSDLRARLREIETAPYGSARQIARIQDLGASDTLRLEGLEASVARRVKDLGAIQDSWESRAHFWQSWSAALRRSPEWGRLAASAQTARKTCESMLALINAGIPKLLDLQRSIEGMRRGNLQVLTRIDEARQDHRDKLLRRSQPFLFSAAFAEDFREEFAGVRLGIPRRGRLDGSFFGQNAGLLFLHLVAMAGIAWIVRVLRRAGRSDERWEVLNRPWTIGAFMSTAFLANLYRPSPLLWDLVLWAVLGLCASTLAGSLFENELLRRAVRFTAVLFPLLYFLGWLALPEAAVRLVLFLVALFGTVLLLIPLRRRLVTPRSLAAVFAAGALVLAAACLAEIAGFDALARWLLQSALATAFAALIVVVLLRLGRGALRALRHRSAGGPRPAVGEAVYRVAQFVARFLAVLIVFGAVLNVLNAWELVPSPWKAWQAMLGAGVTLGGVKITVGRVLGSALLLYAAFLTSVGVRALLSEEVLPRKQIDRGVGDAMQTLVHYAIVVIGIALALSALGIRLEALAIVIGALGVGIGFGLQNIVNNFVSGLILLFERPVRAGDTVVIGGEWGMIRSIGLRSTVLSVYDGSEVVVPNGELVSQRVTNWTLTSGRNRIIVEVGVAYGSDIEKVFEILSAAASEHPAVLSDPAPQILFAGFGSSSLDFEVRVWLPEVSLRLPTQSELRTDIDRRFRTAGIEIPFPQRDLHLRSVDEKVARGFGRPSGADGSREKAPGPPPERPRD